jgi:hypothetical protein
MWNNFGEVTAAPLAPASVLCEVMIQSLLAG